MIPAGLFPFLFFPLGPSIESIDYSPPIEYYHWIAPPVKRPFPVVTSWSGGRVIIFYKVSSTGNRDLLWLRFSRHTCIDSGVLSPGIEPYLDFLIVKDSWH